MMDFPKRNLKTDLNRMSPAAARVKLGDVIDELIIAHNSAMAKLDADAGVTDTNFVATLSVKTLSER